MKNEKTLNFLPLYNYKFKLFGFGLLLLSGAVLLLSGTLIKELPYDISLWAVGFSLTVINFSKEKNESDKLLPIRYYSGKLTASFIIGLIMSTSLIQLVTGSEVDISNLTLMVTGLVLYFLSFNFLKFYTRNTEAKVLEEGIFKSLKSNIGLVIIVALLSIITLSIIIAL